MKDQNLKPEPKKKTKKLTLREQCIKEWKNRKKKEIHGIRINNFPSNCGFTIISDQEYAFYPTKLTPLQKAMILTGGALLCDNNVLISGRAKAFSSYLKELKKLGWRETATGKSIHGKYNLKVYMFPKEGNRKKLNKPKAQITYTW